MEAPGIDPGASRMQSERSTMWAKPPKEDFSSFLFMLFVIYVKKLE